MPHLLHVSLFASAKGHHTWLFSVAYSIHFSITVTRHNCMGGLAGGGGPAPRKFSAELAGIAVSAATER